MKHIRLNKYLVSKKEAIFVTLILCQEHCTIHITNKHLKRDLSHAYVLSKLVSNYLGSLEWPCHWCRYVKDYFWGSSLAGTFEGGCVHSYLDIIHGSRTATKNTRKAGGKNA